MTGTELGGVTRVQIGEHEVTVDFNNDTHLVVTIPPVPEPEDSSVYQLFIFVPNKGYALMEESVLLFKHRSKSLNTSK